MYSHSHIPNPHSQVHENGHHPLATVVWLLVDLVVEEVMVGLILLSVMVVQDLQPLLVLCACECTAVGDGQQAACA